MSLEEREGSLDQVSDNGILLSGARLSYSKWFEGERPTEDALGRVIRVVVDAGDKCAFLKKVLRIGEKLSGWKRPENPKGGPWVGGGRRMSPEELVLKREEGIRIARSVAVDKAIAVVRDGIAVEKIAPLARVIEGYLLSGQFSPLGSTREPEKPSTPVRPSSAPALAPAAHDVPSEAPKAPPSGQEARPPAAGSRTRRPDPKVVNDLFNEAKVAGLVSDWNGYLALCRGVVKSVVKSPYGLTAQEFAQVEVALRGRLGGSASRGKVA